MRTRRSTCVRVRRGSTCQGVDVSGGSTCREGRRVRGSTCREGRRVGRVDVSGGLTCQEDRRVRGSTYRVVMGEVFVCVRTRRMLNTAISFHLDRRDQGHDECG